MTLRFRSKTTARACSSKIRQKAVQQGLVMVEEAVDVQKAAQLIFAPGFTTAASVSDISGRGIGMDVVRTEIQSLGGHIVTTSDQGRGTTFQMVMPLTTAVTQVVMMRAKQYQVYSVPANGGVCPPGIAGHDRQSAFRRRLSGQRRSEAAVLLHGCTAARRSAQQ